MEVGSSLIHRLFYPQVPLILAAELKGRVSAMPVVSYASMSDSPPLIAIACNPRSFTCKLALKAKAFSLSVIDEDQAAAVAALATLSGRKVKDKLAAAGLSHTRGKALDVPVIKGSEATLELTLSSRRKLGDHLLLVGEVKSAYASSAFDEFWDFQQYNPILYTGWKDGLSTFSPEE